MAEHAIASKDAEDGKKILLSKILFRKAENRFCLIQTNCLEFSLGKIFNALLWKKRWQDTRSFHYWRLICNSRFPGTFRHLKATCKKKLNLNLLWQTIIAASSIKHDVVEKLGVKAAPEVLEALNVGDPYVPSELPFLHIWNR